MRFISFLPQLIERSGPRGYVEYMNPTIQVVNGHHSLYSLYLQVVGDKSVSFG